VGDDGRVSERPDVVDIGRVAAAADAIKGAVVRTPVAHSQTLSDITGATVFVKFENLQFTGSYKERGALFRLLNLDGGAQRRGVVTASAGNFAQAVAYHASRLKIPATIVMPAATPSIKVGRCEGFGATIVLKGDGFDEASTEARSLASGDGLTFLSAFDDPDVVAGQGTTALEFLDDVPDLDVLVVPVGGGGLLSGMAVVARARLPHIEMVGVQSERYPAMVAALTGTELESGGPTIAEGIAVASPGQLTREILKATGCDVVTVPEARIEEAVCLYLEVEKTVAEGAGAAGLAALREYPERFSGRRVGLVLSGGNIGLLLLASVITRGMIRSDRLLQLTVDLPDSPGSLGALTALLGTTGANIIDVSHERRRLEIPSRMAQVNLTVETRGAPHAAEIVEQLRRAGYSVTIAPPSL
jgi:threonine dehydratase